MLKKKSDSIHNHNYTYLVNKKETCKGEERQKEMDVMSGRARERNNKERKKWGGKRKKPREKCKRDRTIWEEKRGR